MTSLVRSGLVSVEPVRQNSMPQPKTSTSPSSPAIPTLKTAQVAGKCWTEDSPTNLLIQVKVIHGNPLSLGNVRLAVNGLKNTENKRKQIALLIGEGYI